MASLLLRLAAAMLMVWMTEATHKAPCSTRPTLYITVTAAPVTKTAYHPHRTVYQTQTQYVPHYVTHTSIRPVTHVVTETKTEGVTLLQTVHRHQATRYVPSHVTHVEKEIVTRTLSQYVGVRRHCTHVTETQTKWVPHYQTVTKVQETTKTVCPKPTYG